MEDLTAKFNNNFVENISSRTVKRRLFESLINIRDTLFLRKLRSGERTDLGASVFVGRNCVGQLRIIGQR